VPEFGGPDGQCRGRRTVALSTGAMTQHAVRREQPGAARDRSDGESTRRPGETGGICLDGQKWRHSRDADGQNDREGGQRRPARRAPKAPNSGQAVNSEAMSEHLREISSQVTVGAHAVLLCDGAGWNQGAKLAVPDNITLLPIPPYSPELRNAGRRPRRRSIPTPPARAE
jgi:hypothetical protein